ncbi:MAG: ABC transporter substrate-binding protein [Chloroflexota bacterium]
MNKRLITLVGTAVIVAAACQGASTTPVPSAAPSVAPSVAPASVAPSVAPASVAPSVAPSLAPAQPNLFDSTYESRRLPGTPGGTVIYGDWQEANLFNPYYNGQVIEANINSAVFRSLVTSTDDFKYALDLATGEPPLLSNGGVVLGQNGDAMTVTWKMKDGQLWSDGTPITCDDVAATFAWVVSPDNSGLYGGTSGYEDVTKVDCPSPTDIVMHFKNVYFDYLVLPGYVLQKTYINSIPIADQVQGKGWSATEMPNVPVSGPYMFDTVTPGQELRLKKNPNYKNPITGETAYLDAIVFKWYGDADTMIAGYRAGEVDAIGDLTDGDMPKIVDLGDQVHPLDALQYEFMRPNWGTNGVTGKTSVMSDPAMRLALALATNKDEINNRIMGGYASPAWTNVSPFAWYYTDPVKIEFNLDQAKSVLDAAGWVVGADGIRAKDGVKAEVSLCTTTRQQRQDTFALVSAWLKEIGIASTVNAVSASDIFATYNESTPETPCNLSRHNFDVAMHTFSVPLSPQSNYGVYQSTQGAPNGQNDANVNSPELDQILASLKGTVDFSKALDLMAQFQKVYVDQVVEVPIYFRKDVNVVQPYVKNWTGNPTSVGYTWNVGDWFIQK